MTARTLSGKQTEQFLSLQHPPPVKALASEVLAAATSAPGHDLRRRWSVISALEALSRILTQVLNSRITNTHIIQGSGLSDFLILTVDIITVALLYPSYWSQCIDLADIYS